MRHGCGTPGPAPILCREWRRPPRILLVDDEESIQKLLTYPLEREGFRVVQARDGEEALERFSAEDVDLVVLDLDAPEAGRARGLPPPAGAEHGADHHAHRPRRRGGQGARARARRRRLHHEAVLDPRVPSRVRALLRRAQLAPAADARRASSRWTAARSTSGGARSRCAAGRYSSPTSSSSSCARSPPPGPGLHAADAARHALGRLGLPRPAHDRRPRPPPAREDRARPERARATSSPCAGSATASGTPMRADPSVPVLTTSSSASCSSSGRGRARRSCTSRRAPARVPARRRQDQRARARVMRRRRRSCEPRIRARTRPTYADAGRRLSPASLNARVVVVAAPRRATLAIWSPTRACPSQDVRADPVALRPLDATCRRPGRVEREGADVRRGGHAGRPGHRRAPLGPPRRRSRQRRARAAQPRSWPGSRSLARGRVVGVLAALGPHAPAPPARGRRGADRRRRLRGAGRSDRLATRSASSRTRSTRCACASPSSTTPAASSSPTRRTSCGRRCSRSGGFLELIDDEELDEETRREFLEETRAQVERLTRLATDLLDLSRLDAGQLASRQRRSTCADGRPHSRARSSAPSPRRAGTTSIERADAVAGPRRRAACAPDRAHPRRERASPHAGRDPCRASRSSPPRTGGPARRPRRRARESPTPSREHLFERFYRAEGGKASGSGLGLAIARELATQDGRRAAGRLRARRHRVHAGAARWHRSAFPRENEPVACLHAGNAVHLTATL